DQKGPARCGLFKNAFTNNVVLVVGTAGTAVETAWSLAQARFDAETFWYVGNGSLPIVLDTEVDATKYPDRNVGRYGNAASSRAWRALVADWPSQVAEGEIRVGERPLPGPDFACFVIRPRGGSAPASVGAIGGPGLAGMRLSSRLASLRSGVAIPDWIIVGP